MERGTSINFHPRRFTCHHLDSFSVVHDVVIKWPFKLDSGHDTSLLHLYWFIPHISPSFLLRFIPTTLHLLIQVKLELWVDTLVQKTKTSQDNVQRSKQVIIGCGGSFRHECGNKYIPVAYQMSEVDGFKMKVSKSGRSGSHCPLAARMSGCVTWSKLTPSSAKELWKGSSCLLEGCWSRLTLSALVCMGGALSGKFYYFWGLQTAWHKKQYRQTKSIGKC